MTSNGLDAAIDTWLAAYAKYFLANKPACDKPCCQADVISSEVEKSNSEEE